MLGSLMGKNLKYSNSKELDLKQGTMPHVIKNSTAPTGPALQLWDILRTITNDACFGCD